MTKQGERGEGFRTAKAAACRFPVFGLARVALILLSPFQENFNPLTNCRVMHARLCPATKYGNCSKMPRRLFRDAELPIEEVPMSRCTYRGHLLVLVALALPLLSCSRHESNETYVFVANKIKLTYWQQAAAGFTASAAQLKVHVKIVGPATFDPKAEQVALQQAIREKPAGIL